MYNMHPMPAFKVWEQAEYLMTTMAMTMQHSSKSFYIHVFKFNLNIPKNGRKSTVTNSPHTLLNACKGHTKVNFFLEKLYDT